MIDGKKMRKEILALRDALSSDERVEKSREIKEKVLNFKEIETAKNVFIYVSFRSEVITIPLIEELMAREKIISVPITHLKDNRLDAIHIKSISEDLVPGYCDILEPRPELLTKNLIEPQNLDVVILPGSVFDERGGRFGYGGGYYDRFVERIPFAVRIGLAFEAQIVETAPLQPHDELLDYIVTEKRIIKAESRL